MHTAEMSHESHDPRLNLLKLKQQSRCLCESCSVHVHANKLNNHGQMKNLNNNKITINTYTSPAVALKALSNALKIKDTDNSVEKRWDGIEKLNEWCSG